MGPLLRSSPASTTSLTRCTASAPSFTGTSGKEWKKASSLRHARTWQHWRKIMRRSESRQPKARARRKDMATSSELRELRGLFWQSSARQHALKTRTVDELETKQI